MVLVRRSEPHLEVGILTWTDGPVELGELAVAYGVELSGAWPLDALARAVGAHVPLTSLDGATILEAGADRTALRDERRFGAGHRTSDDGSPASEGSGGLTGAAAGGCPPEAPPVVWFPAGQPISDAVQQECPDRAANGEPPGPEGDSSGPFCVWCRKPMQLGRRGQRRLTCSDGCRQARRRSLRDAAVRPRPHRGPLLDT